MGKTMERIRIGSRVLTCEGPGTLKTRLPQPAGTPPHSWREYGVLLDVYDTPDFSHPEDHVRWYARDEVTTFAPGDDPRAQDSTR